MKRAILIRDIEEYNAAKLFFGTDFTKMQIYALHPPKYLELMGHTANINIFSQHISSDEAAKIYSDVFNELTKISDNFPNYEPLDINFFRFFKVYYWQWLTEIYALHFSLKKLVDDIQFDEIYHIPLVLPEPKTHASLFDGYLISDFVFNTYNKAYPSIVKRLDHKISHEKEYTNYKCTLPVFKKIKNKIFSLISNGIKIIPNGKFNQREFKQQNRIIAFGSGYDALIVIKDAIRLADGDLSKVLWMTEGVDNNSQRSGLAYIDEYDQIERFSINSYLSKVHVPGISKDIKDDVTTIFELMINKVANIDLFNFFDLKSQTACLKKEFLNVVERSYKISHVLSLFKGSSIVVTNFNGFDERIIEQVANKYNIDVHARPHGWIGNYEGFEYQANCYYCNGELSSALIEDKLKYSNIVIEPDPSILAVSKKYLKKYPSPDSSRVFKERRVVGIDSQYVILLMTTAARYRCILNELEFAKLHDSWMHIIEYLKMNPNITILVKSHKFNYNGWFKKKCDENNVQNILFLEGKLEDAVILADLVVNFGKTGSAVLTPLTLDRPLLLYNGMYKYVRDFGDIVHKECRMIYHDEPVNLIQEFYRMQNEGQEYLNSIKFINQDLLYKLFHYNKK